MNIKVTNRSIVEVELVIEISSIPGIWFAQVNSLSISGIESIPLTVLYFESIDDTTRTVTLRLTYHQH